MGTKKINALRCCFALFLIIASGILAGCRGRASREVRFSYGTILRNEYIYNVGKVVPVTIEQNIEFDGNFSEDGLYLYYASDRDRGNFDVYLRALGDITTVRITAHPAKDISPAISPDGKRLAFVSLREDPEGDIFVVDIDPAKLLEKAAGSPTEIPTLDSRAKNITQYQDPASKDIRIIRDASPAWSPDSNWIAFSSNRDGKDNIWMIDRKGRNIKQITTKGGLYPRFSPDGKKIMYISYRDENSRGDVYIKNLETGVETRITSTPHIELYPSFMKNEHEIVYTLIDRDTNRDGAINLKDASIIMYKNIKTGMEYPLTLRSHSSFAPRFSEALRKVNERFFNVIIFSDQIGENININIIPEEGIIPRKNNAQQQYDLAQAYLDEHDDRERYLLGLERAYHFFGDKKDSISQIFVAKSLVEAGKAFLEAKDRSEAARIGKILSSISKGAKDYRAVMAQYLGAYLEGKSGESVLAGALGSMARDSKAAEFVPYLIEDLGDEQSRFGKADAALRTYRKILDEHPRYGRAQYINFKIAKLQYRAVSPDLPEAYVRTINSDRENLKIAAAKELVRIFSAEANIEKRISAASSILSKAEKKSGNDVLPMMQYLLGEAYFAKRDYAKAKEYLEQTLSGVSRTNYLFYKANKLIGDIAHIRGDVETMEKHYYQNVKNYLLRWKQADFRDILTRLVDYYEEKGAVYLEQKKDKLAQGVYEKYIEVVTSAHLLREFDDIYQAYGSRAHVLYIDSFARNSEKEKLFKLDEKYSDKLSLARLNYDKSYIYGLAYIYTKLALAYDDPKGGELETSLEYFKKSLDQVGWALFMDDAYVEPYILRGWIGQYVDLRRKDLGEEKERLFGKFFPRLLWEANVPLYERALAANDESKNPEGEGNIHLNLANTYFLLNNYPQALRHFEKANEFKRDFGSPVQEALFRFHFGVCYWQNDRISEAREEMRKTLLLYNSMSQKSGHDRFKEQIFTLYRYFALFDRTERNFDGAIFWYNEILNFTEKKNISVDRARMLQEIATCYKELGNREKAVEYLDRADKILEKETEEERTYKLRFKVLGVGPVSFIDLGPDTVVIGDNRLYSELDTENKKILSLSLREDMHFDRGDYAAAVGYLKKKMAHWEKKNARINKTGKARALNNIGYCFYKMGLYDNALSYFKQAWDYTAGEDVGDLEGMFSAILNYSNLCAMLLERGDDPVLGRYDELFTKISRYRDTYEKQKFEADLEAKKKQAKLRNKELAADDIDALRQQAALSASEVYHFLDVALGTLKFAQAEHVSRLSNDGANKDDESRAYQVYRENKKLFELYSSAMGHFKSALSYAEKRGNNLVKGKLLLNIAACQEKTGAYEDAYDTLSRAETIASNFAYSNLLWMVQYKLGEFLNRHGAAVEGAGAKRIAREYYEKAVGEMYQCPQCHAKHSHHAGMLFDSYTRFLLEAGDWREALGVMEKGYGVMRLMLFSLADRDFYDPSHREKFQKRQNIVQELISAKSTLSQLLEAGESRDSEKVKNARNVAAQKEAALRADDAAHKKDGSLFSSFLAVPETAIAPISGVVVVGFFGMEGKLGAWKLDAALSYSELKAARKEDAGKAVREYLAAACGNNEKRCFVVLNETALSLFADASLKQYPAFTFVPSFERAKYFAGKKAAAVDAMYGATKKLAQLLRSEKALSGAVVDEYTETGADLSKYSLLIGGGDELSVEPQAVLQRKAAAGLYVHRASKNSLERIVMAAESSLYAGMSGLLVHNISHEGKLSKLIASLREKSLSAAAREMDGEFVLPLGRGLKE